jgi:hypothetical protein
MTPQSVSTQQSWLHEILGRLRGATDCQEKAYHFLRAAPRAFFALRGEVLATLPEEISTPDFEIRRGLRRLLFDESIEEMRARLDAHAKALRATVSVSISDDDIPDEVVEDLVSTSKLALDYACLRLLISSNHIPALNKPDFLRGFDARFLCVLDHLADLPRPTPVAESLQSLSRLYGLQGNRLFPWWEDSPDSERAEEAMLCLQEEEPVYEFEGGTDWDRMPEEVKTWDESAFPEVAPAAIDTRWNEIAPSLHEDLIAFLRPHLSFNLPRPQTAAAASSLKAVALYPFYSMDLGNAPLVVRSLGTDEGGWWHIEAWPDPPLPYPSCGERKLNRLSVYSRPDGRLLDSAAADGMKSIWDVRIALAGVPELSVFAELNKDQRDLKLGELLSQAPNRLFDWVLGNTEDT